MKTSRQNLNGSKMPYPVERPVVFIVGPTAVGKTEIAVHIANQLQAEIISADSRLFYREMDIGTAKPSNHERNSIKHHLIDVADPDETWSLAIFQNAAMAAIDQILENRKLPIVVGGTGQYIRALIEGWTIPELEPCQPLRHFLLKWAEEIGPEQLYQKLQVVDPEAAKRIEWQNTRRTIRALEVMLITGKRFSDSRRNKTPKICYKMVGLNRSRGDLYQRIDLRLEKMIADGFIAEVQALLSKGYSSELPSFSAIGYREIAASIQGIISLEEAISLIQKKTRVFVRRQANWFKTNDQRINWFEVQPGIENKIIDFINEDPDWICD